MSNAASQGHLEVLHSLVVERLTEVIKFGIPVMEGAEHVTDEDGNPQYIPAPPAYFAQAVKILKDNDITAVLTPDSPLHGLIENLPEFSDEEGELPTQTH